MLKLTGIKGVALSDFNFEIFDEGDYPFMVVDAEIKERFGAHSIALTLKVKPLEGFSYHVKFFMNNSDKMMWKNKMFLRSICFDEAIDKEEVTAHELIGKVGAAHFSQSGYERNGVRVNSMTPSSFIMDDARNSLVSKVFTDDVVQTDLSRLTGRIETREAQGKRFIMDSLARVAPFSSSPFKSPHAAAEYLKERVESTIFDEDAPF